MNKIGDESVSAQTLEERLDVSNLTYLAKDDANVVVERSVKIQYADSPQYNETSEIVINWQTGNDYISTRDSYLRLEVSPSKAGADLDATTGFGKGFVTNLFRRIRVVSRSGDVISHIDKSNLLNYYKIKYEHTKAWRAQQGSLIGNGVSFGTAVASNKQEFIVPLSMLAPVFDTDMLLPNMLCKGLRIEISMENVATAFDDNTATPSGITTYSVTSVEAHLDSYRLSDGAQNLLNDEAKSRGLVLQYFDYENSSFTKTAAETQVSLEVRKTASMANSAFSVARPSANINLVTEDSFKSTEYKSGREYQYRIGSVYMPVQHVAGINQAYNYVGYCLGKLNRGIEMGVNLEEFTGAGDDGDAIDCVSIDRYWLDNSGLALNNSTSLNYNARGLPAVGLQIDIFLKHTRSLNIFLENLVRSD